MILRTPREQLRDLVTTTRTALRSLEFADNRGQIEFVAADNLAVIGRLPGPRCEELKGNRAGTFSVRVHDGYRLIFVPDHDPVPRKDDGGVDGSAITAIRVEAIEDYHD